MENIDLKQEIFVRELIMNPRAPIRQLSRKVGISSKLGDDIVKDLKDRTNFGMRIKLKRAPALILKGRQITRKEQVFARKKRETEISKIIDCLQKNFRMRDRDIATETGLTKKRVRFLIDHIMSRCKNDLKLGG